MTLLYSECYNPLRKCTHVVQPANCSLNSRAFANTKDLQLSRVFGVGQRRIYNVACAGTATFKWVA